MQDWREWARQPLARSLVLSLGMHLALLAIVQPWHGSNAPSTLIIDARLQTTSETASESPAPAMEPPEAPSPPDARNETNPPQPTPPQPDPLSIPKPAPIQAAEPPPAKAPPQATGITAGTSEPSPVPAPSEPAGPAPSAPAIPAPPLANPSPIDTNWYLARQVDRHPKAIGSILPKYPEEARQRGQEGSLKLMVKIDDLGRVQDVEVVEASPPGVFDSAAVEAFRNARFQPAMKDGRPVRYQAYMRVEFRLE
jgi:protein TonB